MSPAPPAASQAGAVIEQSIGNGRLRLEGPGAHGVAWLSLTYEPATSPATVDILVAPTIRPQPMPSISLSNVERTFKAGKSGMVR